MNCKLKLKLSIFDSNINKNIILGRYIDQLNNKVDINFNENSTSSIQCTIFHNGQNWQIVDSDGSKRSLNGTWFLINKFIKLENESTIKLGSTSIKINLTDID